MIDGLSKLSGEDFDKAYLLTTLSLYEDIERNVLGELLSARSNPQLVSWSKDFVVAYARNATAAQQLSAGTGDGNPVVPATAGDPNRKGPTADQMTPGQLFGVTIGAASK